MHKHLIKNVNMADSFWTRTRLKWTVIGQCAVTVGLLVTLLSLVMIWHMKRSTAIGNTERTICVPCYELKWPGSEDLTGFEKKNATDADYMACCSVGSRVLDKLIKKHAFYKHKDTTPARVINSIGEACWGKKIDPHKPYVKMTGINFKLMSSDSDNLIRWNTTQYQGNITPKQGKVFIKEPRFYYVFSYLTLEIWNDRGNQNPAHSHYVIKQSYIDGTIKPLLENSQSFCETTSATSETTSTIGAVFQLEKYDKLFVRSSHQHRLVSSECSNAFGLYMM